MELEQYEYQFEYKQGIHNEGPDALSRIAVGREESDDIDHLEDHIYVVKMASMDDWKSLVNTEQRNEASIKLAIDQLERSNNVQLGRYKNYKQLFMQDGLLTK